ncbi:MAG: class I SAM-dependent methyltransferase, partial [Gemmatimonadetes bacterium]|nr:class I SAM-dependent methyltransferase [Gemmatimonadota bacterium]
MTKGRTLAALYTAAIFVAAALLFLVQPVVGKMVLPRAGGSPQVWNTAMVFFQTALLAGYAYAHFSVRWLGVRRQAMAHMLLLALPLLALPIALPNGYPPVEGGQSLWILGVLLVAVGAPFFVLASASPLLQRWLAATEHEAAADPYFLYAGSNAGSLVGLLAFPLLLEPTMPGAAQSRLWMVGYLVFVVLAAACALVAVRA